MELTKIKFGTSGWRAILSDEFTFENVRRVLDAIVIYIRENNPENRPVIVGSDARFLCDNFRKLASEHLAKNGIPVFCTDRDCPTPVISFCIREHNLAGGINFTASHNPAEYQGIKFSPANGAPASNEVTDLIEKYIDLPVAPAAAVAEITMIDPREEYLAELTKFLDFDKIKAAKLKVGCDVLYGAGRGYLDAMLERAGAEVTMLHDYINPSFEGRRPEPAPENIPELIDLVKNSDLNLGLSTDGDADRFGIIDSDGSYYNPNQVLCLLSWHLLKNKGLKGKIVRTVATSGYIDRIATYFDTEVIEVPVGFKYIGPLILTGEIVLGGEESGGLSIGGHIPEKDGILACGLIAELVATENKPLKEIWGDIEAAIGKVWTGRANLTLTDSKKVQVLAELETMAKDKFLGREVIDFNGTDGYKFVFNAAEWVLVRPSGTEPIVRCYTESDSEEKGKKLESEIVAYITK